MGPAWWVISWFFAADPRSAGFLAVSAQALPSGNRAGRRFGGVCSPGPRPHVDDAERSTDHPLITRYPGSTINEYAQKAFDEYELPLSKFAGGKYEKTQHLEGKITAIYYTTPEGRSSRDLPQLRVGTEKRRLPDSVQLRQDLRRGASRQSHAN